MLTTCDKFVRMKVGKSWDWGGGITHMHTQRYMWIVCLCGVQEFQVIEVYIDPLTEPQQYNLGRLRSK